MTKMAENDQNYNSFVDVPISLSLEEQICIQEIILWSGRTVTKIRILGDPIQGGPQARNNKMDTIKNAEYDSNHEFQVIFSATLLSKE